MPLSRVQDHASRAYGRFLAAFKALPERFTDQIAGATGAGPVALRVAMVNAFATVLDELSQPAVRA